MGVNEVATSTSWGTNGWLPSCGTNKSHGTHHAKSGAYIDLKAGAYTNYSTTPLKQADGSVSRETHLGANGQFEVTFGKANEDRSNFFECTLEGHGGTDLGGGFGIKNTKIFAQSPNERHEGGWNVELSTKHDEKLSNLIHKREDDYKGYNPHYSSTVTKFTMGPQYSYKDRLFIGINGGAQHTYTVDKQGETRYTYNEFGATGSVDMKYYIPVNAPRTGCAFAPYIGASAGVYAPGKVDENSPIKISFGQVQAQGEFKIGASF